MQRDIEIKRETGMMTKQKCDELCIFPSVLLSIMTSSWYLWPFTHN